MKFRRCFGSGPTRKVHVSVITMLCFGSGPRTVAHFWHDCSCFEPFLQQTSSLVCMHFFSKHNLCMEWFNSHLNLFYDTYTKVFAGKWQPRPPYQWPAPQVNWRCILMQVSYTHTLIVENSKGLYWSRTAHTWVVTCSDTCVMECFCHSNNTCISYKIRPIS